jgi:predicted nucleic acid-binding protein
MILAALKGLAALPRIIDAIEALQDVAVARMALERMENKNEEVEDIIAAATARREQRLLDGEAARFLRDSAKASSGDGKRDIDG